MSAKPGGLLKWLEPIRAWDAYEEVLRAHDRFSPAPRKYFDDLIAACLDCRDGLFVDVTLYRARVAPLHHQNSDDPLPQEELTAPPIASARQNRLNPEGIRYLYTALEIETAIAEVRPWTGARVTVAALRCRHPKTVVDLRGSRTGRHTSEDLQWLSTVIGTPVHQDDRLAYIGTQCIAATLRRERVDGVLYDSALAPGGTNVALFDPDSAEIGERRAYRVRRVEYHAPEIIKPRLLNLGLTATLNASPEPK